MRTKAILLMSVFILILLIPVSFATGIQNFTLENNMTSTQTLGYSHSPTGATQTNTTRTSSLTSDLVTTFVPTSTKNANPFNTSPPPSTGSKAVKIWLIVILLVIMVVMVLVAYLHHVCQQSNHGGSVPRFLLDVRERLRTWIRNLEDHLGVQLWPGDKRTAEDAMEDTEGGQAEEGEVWKANCGEGANSELSNEEKGEHKEEDSDTSDDYSSLEGDDLRERALNRQKEEEGNQSKDKDEDETSTSSDEGQSHSEGISGGNKNEDSEETALVISPQQDDLCDVTVL